eukprot:1161667-Pelagomonas_calceolata.AAC.10
MHVCSLPKQSSSPSGCHAVPGTWLTIPASSASQVIRLVWSRDRVNVWAKDLVIALHSQGCHTVLGTWLADPASSASQVIIAAAGPPPPSSSSSSPSPLSIS